MSDDIGDLPSHRPLQGLRVLECSSFVAGPSGCMTLATMGADVIRVDPIGGAADHGRWPVSNRTGESLYWSALNRGKRSVCVDLRQPEGRELVVSLATLPGPDAGVIVDNNVGRPWLAYDALVQRRSDLIQVHIQGHPDGRPAVDYTVNAEVGVPDITGPASVAEPVNHVLPAWDLLTGMTAVTALLSALRRRDRTGEGSFLSLALADVALAGVASLGWLAEAAERGDRPRHGNHVYGSFGVDFATLDHHRVMVVALTSRQWKNLRDVTKTDRVFRALEEALQVDLAVETDRYQLRETIAAVLRPWFAARTVDEVTQELDAAQVLWSRYRTMAEAVKELAKVPDGTVVTQLEQPGIGVVTSARSPIRSHGVYTEPRAAPRLGENTDEVLTAVLGLDPHEVSRLHDRGVIGGER
ncbi:2-methylfumaryl-CoA isomerase [Nocardioides immobilis]|uniref:2-methylfumaryl-CoA isomerase n=1 Tax=Nocardioides immobilis TaxID=2049295 RepID=A0A417XTG6_9ACTN|nr:CoA transferase [Nocardioides immobilis]RHW23794.1 2-methylfumaryl-CoA isomerase [Nocardioides immobilis]